MLCATQELMLTTDLRAISIDRIAKHSGVTKATIYKWWSSKTEVAIEALLEQLLLTEPDPPDTGSAYEDLRQVLRRIMVFYTTPYGRVWGQLVGEAQFDPVIQERIRKCQVNVRQEIIAQIWKRGVDRGELDPNVDPGLALDLIFGAATYRMATGHGTLTPEDADTITDLVIRAITL